MPGELTARIIEFFVWVVAIFLATVCISTHIIDLIDNLKSKKK